MKNLVVYYSRDGHTRIVAQELAAALKADIEEIKETQSRKGIMGYLTAGRDAIFKKKVQLEPASINPAGYDLVIIGTPVWGFTMCPGIRSWLIKHAANLKKVAFFATMGGQGDKRAFAQMEELCNKSPMATASFIDKAIMKNEHKDKLKAFLELLPKSE